MRGNKGNFCWKYNPPGGGGLIWVGMCRPGLQIGTPFLKKFPLKLIPRSRIRPKTNTPF